MRKLIVAAILSAFCVSLGAIPALAEQMPAAQGEQPAAKVPVPKITKVFASPEVWPGETWRIYLNAQHPAGEMKQFVAIVDQPGVGQYPISMIRIKDENRKELSGYLYLVTATPWDALDFVNLKLTIYIQDRAGKYSEPVEFPLSIQSRYIQEAPEPGIFKDEALGPIMIKLKKVRGGKGGRS
ncbi:MAG TPA: hypothetical protein VLS90_05050 [Thermodesulfobacteriota bacterium]|nr:hypothetical protein [Thermodesulfobacteriota bacterium]